MPNRVKCLHSLVAHSLAAGPDVNPLGDEAPAKERAASSFPLITSGSIPKRSRTPSTKRWRLVASRVAAIDCGTNSIRLLIADIDGNTFREVVRDMEIVRLGQGVDQTGQFHPDAIA